MSKISRFQRSQGKHMVRTFDILVPNLSGILFPLVYSGFRRFLICFTYFLTLLSPLFPGVPAPSVVIYVVKNASRPVFGELSPVPDGKRFAFQIVCIVTLSRVLCKWFLHERQLSNCGAINLLKSQALIKRKVIGRKRAQQNRDGKVDRLAASNKVLEISAYSIAGKLRQSSVTLP